MSLKHLLRNRARLAGSHADDLEDIVLIRHRGNRAALFAFQPLGFRNRRAQSHRNIVAEMFSADRQNNGMPHGAVVVDRHAGFSAADVDQNRSQFFFVVAENGFGRGNRDQGPYLLQEVRSG